MEKGKTRQEILNTALELFGKLLNVGVTQHYGIVDGDWVNIKSPRTDGKDVFRDITTGLSTDTVMAGGKDAKFGPSEFAPGEELTANG